MSVSKIKERIRNLHLKQRMLALQAPSEIVRTWFHKETARPEKICTTCSHVGVPAEEMPGRREIELTLWSVFATVAVGFLFFVLLGEFIDYHPLARLINAAYRSLKRLGELFVFLSLAYTIYRVSLQRECCTKCQSTNVIPLDSPRALELLKKP